MEPEDGGDGGGVLEAFLDNSIVAIVSTVIDLIGSLLDFEYEFFSFIDVEVNLCKHDGDLSNGLVRRLVGVFDDKLGKYDCQYSNSDA